MASLALLAASPASLLFAQTEPIPEVPVTTVIEQGVSQEPASVGAAERID